VTPLRTDPFAGLIAMARQPVGLNLEDLGASPNSFIRVFVGKPTQLVDLPESACFAWQGHGLGV
jgi:hypothetical protein